MYTKSDLKSELWTLSEVHQLQQRTELGWTLRAGEAEHPQGQGCMRTLDLPLGFAMNLNLL